MAKRILIVEDEPLIAMLLEDLLDALGYDCAGAADGVPGALALIGSATAGPGAIDGAIIDVNLRGGEKSWPVADALAARGIPFVIATGGGDSAITERHRARPRLNKPFSLDGVDRALAALLS